MCMMMGENKTYFLAKQQHQKKGERSRPLRSDNSPFIICQEIRPLLLMEHISQCVIRSFASNSGWPSRGGLNKVVPNELYFKSPIFPIPLVIKCQFSYRHFIAVSRIYVAMLMLIFKSDDLSCWMVRGSGEKPVPKVEI